MWALVHSTFETDVARGRELAQELLASKQLEERSEHDCIYLLSVALYRQGRLLDARRQLSELLKVRKSVLLRSCFFASSGAPALVPAYFGSHLIFHCSLPPRVPVTLLGREAAICACVSACVCSG